jgi:hypothetical protein
MTDSMDLSAIVQALHADDLRQRIRQYLFARSSTLPLADLCSPGGYPDVKHIEISDLARSDGRITCTAAIEFFELRSASCGVDANRNKSCVLRVTLDDSSGPKFELVEELWDGSECCE